MGNRDIKTSNETKEEIVEGLSLRVTTPSRAYPRGGGGGGGGGTQIYSVYVGSDPASTIHPKKISGISSTPKKYLKF